MANEISINISSVLNLSAMCGNTSLKSSQNQGVKLIYLRQWSCKESIDRQEVDEEAPGLNDQLVCPYDVPTIL